MVEKYNNDINSFNCFSVQQAQWKCSTFVMSIKILILLTYMGQCNKSETLFLVHVLFRHGDRTPVAQYCYPNNPYKNYDYFPVGIDALTNEGKRRAFSLGTLLHKRYGNYLGHLYQPKFLEAHTTDMERTKMTLLLVLAGLFPPVGNDQWHEYLDWQPIAYKYKPLRSDKILSGLFTCPDIPSYLKEQLKSKRVQELYKNYSIVFDTISEHSGWSSVDLYSVLYLFSTLNAEEEWGLELPKWASKIYPHPMTKINSLIYYIGTETTELKKIIGGYLLQKIIADTQAKIKNNIDTKMFLYAAHDINVASFLNIFGEFKPHQPPYAACIIIEIHKIDKQYGVKVFYKNYKNITAGQLKLPNCAEICPLEQFISLVEKYLPDETVCK